MHIIKTKQKTTTIPHIAHLKGINITENAHTHACTIITKVHSDPKNKRSI